MGVSYLFYFETNQNYYDLLVKLLNNLDKNFIIRSVSFRYDDKESFDASKEEALELIKPNFENSAIFLQDKVKNQVGIDFHISITESTEEFYVEFESCMVYKKNHKDFLKIMDRLCSIIQPDAIQEGMDTISYKEAQKIYPLNDIVLPIDTYGASGFVSYAKEMIQIINKYQKDKEKITLLHFKFKSKHEKILDLIHALEKDYLYLSFIELSDMEEKNKKRINITELPPITEIENIQLGYFINSFKLDNVKSADFELRYTNFTIFRRMSDNFSDYYIELLKIMGKALDPIEFKVIFEEHGPDPIYKGKWDFEMFKTKLIPKIEGREG